MEKRRTEENVTLGHTIHSSDAPMWNGRIIRRISDTIILDNEKLVSLNNDAHSTECRFMVASNKKLRERAYRLAYTIYIENGLVSTDPSGMVVSSFDRGPEMFTILAEDDRGEDIGTISLVFDSPKGLPCDDIYHEEIDRLRKPERRLAEVTRLVVKKECSNPHEVLLRLFNLIYIYAVRVRHYTDFVIEINPRHAPYYDKKLFFKPIGEKKSCSRVQDAPAVLAHLDLLIAVDEVKRVGGSKTGREKNSDRTLYPSIWSYHDEPLIAKHLHREYRVMLENEAEYFGLLPENNEYNVGLWRSKS